MDESFLKVITTHYDVFKSKIGHFSEDIEGNDALFVWQFVRFNEWYQKEYESLDLDEKYEVMGFCGAWGMSIPVSPKEKIPPKELRFKQSLVRYFDARKFIKEDDYRIEVGQSLTRYLPHRLSFLPPNAPDETIAFVINAKDDKRTILKILEEEITQRQGHLLSTRGRTPIIASSNKDELLRWFLSYHLHIELGLKQDKAAEKISKLVGSTSDRQIRRDCESFINICNHAPYTFFIRTK